MLRALRLAAFLVPILLVCLTPMAAQDPAKVGPKIYNCVFENERIRICEIRFKPGDSIAVHSHPDHALYVMEAGRIRITPKGGSGSDADFTVGQTVWIPAESHSAVNTGKTNVRALVIEVKESPSMDPVERAVIQMEREWADAMMKGDMATLDRIVASDWTLVNPMGQTQTRAAAMADLRSGDLKFESTTAQDLKVRVFGDTAVVTGMTNDKGTYKGQDISGQYQFTDVFVKRDGRWQAVSTHVTKVMP